MTIRRSEFVACTAIFMDGMLAAFASGRQGTRGGGVLLRSYSHATVDQSVFDRCAAEAGGALAATLYTTLELLDTRIMRCRAVNNSMVGGVQLMEQLGVGGSLHACCMSMLNVSQVTISESSAENAGGAIFVGSGLSASPGLNPLISGHYNQTIPLLHSHRGWRIDTSPCRSGALHAQQLHRASVGRWHLRLTQCEPPGLCVASLSHGRSLRAGSRQGDAPLNRLVVRAAPSQTQTPCSVLSISRPPPLRTPTPPLAAPFMLRAVA